MSFILMQLLTGLSYGMLYFMIAAGLTIILGVMNIVNLAHGAFFLIGSYVAFSLVNHHLNFWPALFAAVIVMAVIGVMVEKVLIKFIYGKELEQVLLTFGLSYIIADVSKWIWGTEMQSLSAPDLLNFSIHLGGGFVFPAYRLFVVLVGLIVASILFYFEFRTKIGAVIRAGVDDREMVSALGVNISLVFTGVFAFGAGLAGLSGALGAPLIGVYPGMDSEILVTSLIVVVVGGLGSWKGSFIGAVLIGVIETLSKAFFPSFSMVTVFAVMMIVLLIRPQGLFGKGVTI